jgi:hypothetical protein
MKKPPTFNVIMVGGIPETLRRWACSATCKPQSQASSPEVPCELAYIARAHGRVKKCRRLHATQPHADKSQLKYESIVPEWVLEESWVWSIKSSI